MNCISYLRLSNIENPKKVCQMCSKPVLLINVYSWIFEEGFKRIFSCKNIGEDTFYSKGGYRGVNQLDIGIIAETTLTPQEKAMRILTSLVHYKKNSIFETSSFLQSAVRDFLVFEILRTEFLFFTCIIHNKKAHGDIFQSIRKRS